MKKLAFMFVAFAAISFASCGNKAAQAETDCCEDSVCCDSVEVVEEATDSVVEGDTVVVEAAAEVVAE